MDATALIDAYRIMDRSNDVLGPFQTVSQAYATCHPEVVGTATAMYLLQGQPREANLPIGDYHYVVELFAMSIRQPRETRVARIVAMAASMSVIPTADLGNMTVEERYLMLHTAALIAQDDMAAVAKKLLSNFPPSTQKNRGLAVAMVAGAFGLLVLFLIISGS